MERLYSNVLNSNYTVYYSTLKYSRVQFSRGQYITVWYSKVKYRTIQYSTVVCILVTSSDQMSRDRGYSEGRARLRQTEWLQYPGLPIKHFYVFPAEHGRNTFH